MALTKVEAEQLQAAQTSITSVGTLTGLTSSGTLSVTNQVAIRETAPGIQSGHSSAHSLQIGRWGGSNNRWMIVPEPEGSPLYSRELAYSFDTDTWTVEGSFAATLSTAAQPNITSVGTLTGLDVSGALTGTTATFTTAGNSTGLILKSTDADAAVGPRFDLVRDSASPADGDVIGQIRFQADNDAGEETTFSSLKNVLEDASDGAEAGSFEINTRLNGQMRSRMFVKPTETVLNDDSQNLSFRVESNGDANMLFVDGGNNRVGIGTASPSQKLQVQGAIRFGDTIADVADGGRPLIYASDGSGSHTGHALVIQARDGAGSEIDFVTGTTPTTRMHIGSSGNVGIGTTDTTLYNNTSGGGIMLGGSAVNRLDVARVGDVVATFNRMSSAGSMLQFYVRGVRCGDIHAIGTDGMAFAAPSNLGAGLLVTGNANIVYPAQNSNGTVAASNNTIDLGANAVRFRNLYLSALLDIKSSNCSGFLQVGSNVLQFGTSTNDPLIFYTSNDERMRLTSTGNLLIGRNGTNNGSTDHGVNLYNTGQIYLYVNSTGNTDAVRVYDGNGALKAAIDSDGDYIDHSDINAKENIQDASSVLSTLSDVKVRSFTWKADGRNQAYGFIAQELKEVVPEAVSPPETEDEMWGVKHAKLVPMLVKAVQEQQATITALEARIVQLENK